MYVCMYACMYVCMYLDEDPARVIDFMLVDFKATLKFKDLNEVYILHYVCIYIYIYTYI